MFKNEGWRRVKEGEDQGEGRGGRRWGCCKPNRVIVRRFTMRVRVKVRVLTKVQVQADDEGEGGEGED